MATDRMQGVFTESMGDLVTYRYVGCQSVLHDRDHAEGWTTLRSHLRGPGSVRGTTLAISMLDTAGINVDRVYLLALTHVGIQLYDPALDVARLHTLGTVTRWARTQVFTECRFEDAERPDRVIGTGSAAWSVIEATPDGFEYTDMGSGYPDDPGTPTMTDAFGLEPVPGGGYRLLALSTRVGSEALHHGPMLAGAEQSALDAAAAATGSDALALQAWDLRIVRAGRQAPFTVTAEVVAATRSTVACRTEMVDAAGQPIAVSHLSFRRADVR